MNRTSTHPAWAWLPALLAALLMAFSAGAVLYFVMSRSHAKAFDDKVQTEVDKQLAEQASAPQGAPPVTVRVGLIESRTLQDRVQLVGRLHEVRRSVVSSEVEGRLLEVLVDQGDEVIGGQTILARVDGTWAQLAIEAAQADLASAQARARQSSRDLEHLQQLAQRGASDPRAIDDAIALAEADAASEMSAQAALHRAEETVNRIEILAPFDGLVTQKHAEVGQWLDQGDDVVEIVSHGEIDAYLDVPERWVGAVELGIAVDIAVESLGQTFTGQVVSIDPDGSNAARTFLVRVRLSDESGALKVGMSILAFVPIMAADEFLVVPRDAIAYGSEKPQVWLAEPMPGAPADQPVAQPVDVEVLFGVGSHVAVREVYRMLPAPFEPGRSVVIEGVEALFPTCPLIVLPAQDESPETPAAHPNS